MAMGHQEKGAKDRGSNAPLSAAAHREMVVVVAFAILLIYGDR